MSEIKIQTELKISFEWDTTKSELPAVSPALVDQLREAVFSNEQSQIVGHDGLYFITSMVMGVGLLTFTARKVE